MTEPSAADEPMVWVRRQWNGWDGARCRLAELEHPHWSQSSGGAVYGFARRSPRPMVHGYVWCDAMLEGELAHSCEHGPAPHKVKVCVVAKDNDPKVMEQLKEWADRLTRR